MKTPEWILEGFDSEEEYNGKKGIKKKEAKEGKIFKIRKCPKCGSGDVSVVLGFDDGKGKGEWECKKCGWVGKNVNEEELSEDKFMKYLDERGRK